MSSMFLCTAWNVVEFMHASDRGGKSCCAEVASGAGHGPDRSGPQGACMHACKHAKKMVFLSTAFSACKPSKMGGVGWTCWGNPRRNIIAHHYVSLVAGGSYVFPAGSGPLCFPCWSVGCSYVFPAGRISRESMTVRSYVFPAGFSQLCFSCWLGYVFHVNLVKDVPGGGGHTNSSTRPRHARGGVLVICSARQKHARDTPGDSQN